MKQGDLYRVYRGSKNDPKKHVEVGVDEGLKHDSAVFCDDLISIPKSLLTDYIGTLSDNKMELVNIALRIALAIG